MFSRLNSNCWTSDLFLFPFLNSSQAKNKLSSEIISSKTLWKTFPLIPPPSGFNLPILHKVYDFYKLFYQYLDSFPRKDRYCIGQKCEILILDILESAITAAQVPKNEKSIFLNEISTKLNVLRIIIRLAKDIKVLDFKKYLILQEKINEIGKMLGGWIKSLK